MPSKKIGEYEVEYSAVQLVDNKGWGAHVAIYGHSTNPMHRNSVFPDQRVSLEAVLSSREEAEAEALRVATDMLETNHSRSS